MRGSTQMWLIVLMTACATVTTTAAQATQDTQATMAKSQGVCVSATILGECKTIEAWFDGDAGRMCVTILFSDRFDVDMMVDLRRMSVGNCGSWTVTYSATNLANDDEWANDAVIKKKAIAGQWTAEFAMMTEKVTQKCASTGTTGHWDTNNTPVSANVRAANIGAEHPKLGVDAGTQACT